MGLGDWFKKTFGKQTCAFCGNEAGMMSRTKIKNDEFICNECARGCSQYISLYRHTKDELLGHIEYMKRQNAVFTQLLEGHSSSVVGDECAIEFYDDFGMFRIRDGSVDRRKLYKEPIRYDNVHSYEPYINESEPDEPGKPMEFGDCGVRIILVGAQEDGGAVKPGTRPHPYITEEIEVCINDSDKERGMLQVNQIIAHFDYIFGVHDNERGLFQFGFTTQQKREAEAFKAMGGVFSAAINAAKTGAASEAAQAQVADAMSKVDAANTSGLSEYSRRADEAEARITL